MFDKLEDLLIRFEEIMGELHEPTVTNNQERFRILLFIIHHNAFQHGLSADTGITTLSSSHKTSSL
jgi:hypothetical protein